MGTRRTGRGVIDFTFPRNVSAPSPGAEGGPDPTRPDPPRHGTAPPRQRAEKLLDYRRAVRSRVSAFRAPYAMPPRGPKRTPVPHPGFPPLAGSAGGRARRSFRRGHAAISSWPPKAVLKTGRFLATIAMSQPPTAPPPQIRCAPPRAAHDSRRARACQREVASLTFKRRCSAPRHGGGGYSAPDALPGRPRWALPHPPPPTPPSLLSHAPSPENRTKLKSARRPRARSLTGLRQGRRRSSASGFFKGVGGFGRVSPGA